MAGIYIHIPFCKQKCHYCDFYKTLETGKREDFIKSLVSEVEQRKNYLSPDTVIDTVYLGGGTPSVLTLAGIRKILKTLKNNFTFSDNPEITIEVNPDDITATYAAGLIKEGINRVSIGIQSFNDETLMMLNRRHDSKQALQSVLVCREAGFRNISIDLIYGIPGMSTGE
ncbi:MAG: radical SAM protein, partial [Clostridia bacterium]|nr:radical SAM protein [Clostridia bacterium]